MKAGGGRRDAPDGKSLRIGVHHANAVVWEPVYRTRRDHAKVLCRTLAVAYRARDVRRLELLVREDVAAEQRRADRRRALDDRPRGAHGGSDAVPVVAVFRSHGPTEKSREKRSDDRDLEEDDRNSERGGVRLAQEDREQEAQARAEAVHGDETTATAVPRSAQRAWNRIVVRAYLH